MSLVGCLKSPYNFERIANRLLGHEETSIQNVLSPFALPQKMARTATNAGDQQIGSRAIQMSQDKPRGFILKRLYYLLAKYKQHYYKPTTASFSNFFVILIFLNLIVHIRFFSARIERFAQKFPKLGSPGSHAYNYRYRIGQIWLRVGGTRSGRINKGRRNARTCSPAQPWCGRGLELVRSPRSTCCFDLENGVWQLKVSSYLLLYNIRS